MPREPNHPPKSSTSPAQPPEQPAPLQNYHPKHFATRCGHEVHPSTPSHTPDCPACILQVAQAKVDRGQNRLLFEGGLYRPSVLRDRRWVRAQLTYQNAVRELEKARRKDQFRSKREQAWEEAHLRSDLERTDEGQMLENTSGCRACASLSSPQLWMPEAKVEKDVPWWEHPYALTHTPEPTTPPPQRSQQHRYNFPMPRGSPVTRRAINKLHTDLLTAESERELSNTREKTEAAVRLKHKISGDVDIDPTFWDWPIHGLSERTRHRRAQESRRSAERRARRDTPWSRLPKSPLSHCQSASEFEIDEEMKEAMNLKEEEDKLEREVWRVGKEVGYLYIVGPIDADEWRGEFRRSNHALISRESNQINDLLDDMLMEDIVLEGVS